MKIDLDPVGWCVMCIIRHKNNVQMLAMMEYKSTFLSDIVEVNDAFTARAFSFSFSRLLLNRKFSARMENVELFNIACVMRPNNLQMETVCVHISRCDAMRCGCVTNINVTWQMGLFPYLCLYFEMTFDTFSVIRFIKCIVAVSKSFNCVLATLSVSQIAHAINSIPFIVRKYLKNNISDERHQHSICRSIIVYWLFNDSKIFLIMSQSNTYFTMCLLSTPHKHIVEMWFSDDISHLH